MVTVHLTQKQKKFLKIIGAISSDIKFRSGRCDENGFICGDCTTLSGRSDSFWMRSRSLGDSISVYDVTTTGQFIAVADLMVFGHVSSPLNPVERYRPGLKKQTRIMQRNVFKLRLGLLDYMETYLNRVS